MWKDSDIHVVGTFNEDLKIIMMLECFNMLNFKKNLAVVTSDLIKFVYVYFNFTSSKQASNTDKNYFE